MEETFTKAAEGALDTIKKFVEEHPVAIASVLGAGGLGAAGGYGLTQEDPNETPSQRVKRRVKNALIGGALGAGSAAALAGGWNAMFPGDNAAGTSTKEPATGAPGTPKHPADDEGMSAAHIIANTLLPPATGLGAGLGTNAILSSEKLNLPKFGPDKHVAALVKNKGPFAALGSNASADAIKDAVEDALVGHNSARANAVFPAPEPGVSRAAQIRGTLGDSGMRHLENIMSTRKLYPEMTLKQWVKSPMFWRNVARKAKLGRGGVSVLTGAGAAAATPFIINALNGK